MSSSFSYVVGFDDFPFVRATRGDVPIVGAVYSGSRLEGVLGGRVRRDGANSTQRIAQLVSGSKYGSSIQLIFLQGIALGGFNVVDIHGLYETLGVPVLVVARRLPRMDSVKAALLTRVPGGARKWRLIERAGEMEPAAGVWVQRAGISLEDATAAVTRFAIHGVIPEPLRTAHLIAGGVATGQSRGRT
ncbi:UPF0215 protein [Capsulimonas corticalis]|uniref:UPF0215 protein n=1 Tax=Capsulimonas corticalis TaxID=2219043 RepID=A0A402D5B1_9BACT|nr:DUF99 family protein [Capsulimonas corticalis]BDI32553.1 UPF0215 protein [Capsulimonas corticalis]